MKPDRLAFDKASARELTQDGRLHVSISNISKAIVNPYFGSEIPGYQSLGLVADQIYMLLRDPVELAKAAPTFNNLPILSRHVPAFVGQNESEWKHLVIGSTGTDALFDAPYVKNSLVFWDSVAIAGIEAEKVKELSSSYRYTPVMTPGVYENTPYDGVMTEIIGNHVALVETGRAGSDVVVNDENPFLEKFDMKKTSRKAVAVKAGLGAHLMPKLAADASIDLTKIVGLPKAKTIDADATRIAQAVIAATTGKLAADAKLDAAELAKIIKLAADAESDKEMAACDEDEQKEGESDEDYKARMAAKKPAADEDDDKDDDKKVDKAAMDAAILVASQEAEKRTIARMTAIRKAEKDVQPIIGDIVAQDSAEAVYKLALDHLKIDVTGVHSSAYSALVAQAKAHANTPIKSGFAQDSAVEPGGLEKAFNIPAARR